MLSSSKLGRSLEKIRNSKNLSQVEVGDKIHVSPKTLSKWEHGDCYPDIQSIESLAELYGVSLNDLLNKNPDDYLKKFNPNALVISLIISGLIVSIIMILKYTVFINVTFESVYMEDLAFSIFVFMFIMFTDINFGIFKKKSIKITLKILLIILDIFYLFF